MALGVLAGCMSEDLVTRGGFGLFGSQSVTAAEAGGPRMAALDGELSDGSQSDLINALLNRRSVLPEGPYRQISQSVLAANARAAEAQLRAAMLRSQARELNWLPTLGPQISLTSLGALVANMVVEQTLFDNGAKRAEREFARADVEVAAVALAQDTNDRVYQALDLYLTAQAAMARATVHEGGMQRMERFEYVMGERVRAGINDRADLQLVQQRLTQMRSDVASDREAAASAMAELAAMSAGDLGGVTGLSSLRNQSEVNPAAVPLDVMKVEAEGTRGLAEARARRAGYLPGITAGGTLGANSSGAVSVAAPNGFSFGNGAEMAALEAQEEAARRLVAEQREASNRALAAIDGSIASLRRQQAQIDQIVRQASDNYTLFEEQLRGGQRSVPEVVGVFRTKLEAEREAVSLRYELARQEVRRALIYGSLVDGEEI